MGPQFSLRTLVNLALVVAICCALLAYSPMLFVVAGIPAGVYGVAVWARLRGAKVDALGVFIFSLIVVVLVSAAVLPQMVSQSPTPEIACLHNLRRIGLALAEYQADYRCYPPVCVADAQGRPLVSWRVLLLPYLGQHALYDEWQQHRDEPWDGPHIRRISQAAFAPFHCPSDGSNTDTSYVAVTGPGTAWPGSAKVGFPQITDGVANTLLVVEVKNSGINWMEPRDLDLDAISLGINPSAGLGFSSNHPGYVNVVYANGMAVSLHEKISVDHLRALLTIAGGEELRPLP